MCVFSNVQGRAYVWLLLRYFNFKRYHGAKLSNQKIQGGYYIKARKVQESKIMGAPPYVREIWDWLLMNANHKDLKYKGFVVKRGQLFRTYKDIREGLAWHVGYRKMMYNENHTKRAMRFLREVPMVATTKELGGVLITILNYDYYQNPKNYERTSKRTTERTNAKPMKNHHGTDNNKNEKNEKNVRSKRKEVKEKKKFSPPSLDVVKKYFDEKGYSEKSANKFFEFYTEGEWIDSKGNPVKNWKQKAIAVWFEDKNKKQPTKIRGKHEFNSADYEPTDTESIGWLND